MRQLPFQFSGVRKREWRGLLEELSLAVWRAKIQLSGRFSSRRILIADW